MRVLVISHMYPSVFSKTSGIFVHQQVKELQRQGCEVKVICPAPLTPFPVQYLSSKWRAYAQVPVNTIWDGVEVYHPRCLSFPRSLLFASSGRRVYTGIRRVVREVFRDFRFDILHAHVALPDGFAGMILKREYDRPLVVTIHGMDMQTTIHNNLDCRAAVSKVLQQADTTVMVSTKLRRIAEADLGFKGRLCVISNGIDPVAIAAGSVDSVDRCALGNVMLSVSSLTASKGLDLNLKAFSHLALKYPYLRYLAIGSGPEERSLKQLAESLNLGNRVEFLGEMSHEKVMRYMAAADIFSLPSWQEGFGVVYLEAMAHGKPVIACQGEGIADVIEHGKTGLLVKPRDLPSLVQALDLLLSNSDEAHDIGEKGKKLVLQNYTWEKNVRKYMGLYEELRRTHG